MGAGFPGLQLLLWAILACSLEGFLCAGPKAVSLSEAARDRDQIRSELSLVAVGDILLSRYIAKKIDQMRDPTFPFSRVQPWLSRADVAFGNLESPITPGEVPLLKGVVFRCLTRYVPGLVYAGFDVLSTANNHAFDQGVENIEFTLDYLDSQKILAVGTRRRGDERSFGRVLERDGTLFGFLAYSYAAYNDGGERQSPQVATWHDREAVSREISQLKQQVDLLFVSIHAGREYRRKPEPGQVEFSHAAIDAGADAVIGHHPHWIQGVEIYRDRPIFYSLGNFVFDQGGTSETTEGLMVEFRIKDNLLTSARVLPIVIEGYCCPRVIDEVAGKAILHRIGLESDTLIFGEPATRIVHNPALRDHR